MRKLSREDKAKADTLVRDGGKAVQHCLYQLSWYDVTLHRSLEDVYGSSTASVTSNPIDGNQPILYLLPSTVTR